MSSLVSKALNLRCNRRYFWIGLMMIAVVTALMAQANPWMLNGGFVLPWVLLHGARLHDFGRQGVWGIAVVAAVLALLSGLAVLNPPPYVYGPAALLALLAVTSFSVWVGIKRGDAETNRFGPAPTGWLFN